MPANGDRSLNVLRHTRRPRVRPSTIVAEMKAIRDEFEAYGYRRVDAELRHRGMVVDTKKIRRLMREHARISKAAQAVYRDDR